MSSNQKLRVHVVIASLTWGGAETLLSDFAVGAGDAGIELSVSYLADRTQAASRLRAEGIEPVLVPIDSLLGRSDRRRVREHIASVAPDLVHTHLGYADLLGGLAARSLGIGSVATLHTIESGGSLRDRTKGRLMALARRHCAARVIAVSEAQRRHYLATGWDRPERVVTVRNGIVGREAPGAGRQVRDELGIAHNDIVATMVAVLRPGKGHDVVAEAVAALRHRFPRLRLLVLGDGPARREIERIMAPLGSTAILAGYRPDVMAALDAADILIHPSSMDALPTNLIEAAAARVPVIATAVGGIPEVVSNGETGVLIEAPPRASRLIEALGRLLDDRAGRRRLASAARARFENEFTVERWLERLLPVYELALAQTRSAGGVGDRCASR